MAKKQKPVAFIEIPWSAARAWLVSQGLDRVAKAIGVDYGTLRAGLSRDNLPAGTCEKLAELSRGKYQMVDFYWHPRAAGGAKPMLEHAKLKHAENVTLLLTHEKA